jgi:hypothetical protein
LGDRQPDYKQKTRKPLAYPMCRLLQGTHVHTTENAMKLALYVEASQPRGRVYRLGVGFQLPPALATTMVLLLSRLF